MPKQPKRPTSRKPQKPKKPNKSPRQQARVDGGTFEVRLTDMAHGGRAVGKLQGRMVFVPYTIPGESVRARIKQEKGNVIFAEGVELTRASADRVTPRCTHFGPGGCWNCQWQHINDKAQLLIKQDVVADQLARLGGFSDSILNKVMRPVVASPQQWGYNYHATLERLSDSTFGFGRENGRSIEPISECHTMHPDLLALYHTLDLDFPTVTRLKLQMGSDGQTMLALYLNKEDAPELEADFPTSVNIVLPDNEPANLIGDTSVTYTVRNQHFRVTAGSFFRANVAQVGPLVDEVLRQLHLQGHEAILDLYAGVGVFSAFIAAKAKLVTLVESYPPAVTDADYNLSQFTNIDVLEGAVGDVLGALADEGVSYYAAVVDPPPSGLGIETIEALLALELKRIVYISGEPSTLSRDAKQLAKGGYRLQRVQPFDFAPQTYYVETVALFER